MIQFGHTILRQAEVIETKVCHDGYAICWTWNARNSCYFYKWGFVCLFVCFFGIINQTNQMRSLSLMPCQKSNFFD